MILKAKIQHIWSTELSTEWETKRENFLEIDSSRGLSTIAHRAMVN
jgi:hypothetical protein